MRKTQQRMAKLHAQIANIRANVVRQLTPICGAINVIIIEDLNGAGMPKKSQAGPGDGGYGLWRISEATRIEGHAMRQKGGGREPFVSQQQNLFDVWAQGPENAPLRARVVVLRMWYAS